MALCPFARWQRAVLVGVEGARGARSLADERLRLLPTVVEPHAHQPRAGPGCGSRFRHAASGGKRGSGGEQERRALRGEYTHEVAFAGGERGGCHHRAALGCAGVRVVRTGLEREEVGAEVCASRLHVRAWEACRAHYANTGRGGDLGQGARDHVPAWAERHSGGRARVCDRGHREPGLGRVEPHEERVPFAEGAHRGIQIVRGAGRVEARGEHL